MNQILSVGNTENVVKNTKKMKQPNNRNNGPIEIKKIIKFFAIVTIIVALFMVGKVIYTIYEDSIASSTEVKPSITVAQASENKLNLTIEHQAGLSSIVYSWNDGENIEISVNQNKKIEKQIEIPGGTNKLKLIATDVNGQVSEYVQTYTVAENININFKLEGSDLKVSMTSEKEISYITYRWGEEEETKIEINALEAEELIEIPEGINVITIIAVDIENNTAEKQQEVEGVKKPLIEIARDTENEDMIIITISDELGLKSISMVANETDKLEQDLNGVKEAKFTYSLKSGENTLKITVINEKDIEHTEEGIIKN